MPAAIQINPSDIFDDDVMYTALGISAATLARARRDGKLRFTRKGKRTLYLGQWVLDWLRADSIQEATHAGQ